jgi:phosphohistidine phosphatase
VKNSEMARQLWLLRHAEAEPHGTRPDPQRRLTERGERQSQLAGQALARMGVEFARVLSSPKERAQRTAALALQTRAERARGGLADGAGFELHKSLEGGWQAPQALAALAGLGPDARLLAVGHEPDLSGVVAALTGAHIDLKKGGLAVVRLASPGGSSPGEASSGDASSGSASREGSAPEDAQVVAGASGGAAGELLLLLRPAELALIAGTALSAV